MRNLSLRTLLLWGLSSYAAWAQLTLSSPQSRIVYQRNPANQGTVWVSGQAPAGTARVEARLVPIRDGQGSPTGWTPIHLISSGKAFSGTLPGQGGWYQLEVRALSGDNVLASAGIDRVGIGEVFIVSGQSNAYGNDGQTGAADDRVSCVDFKDDNLDEQLLPLAFSHADQGRSIGPSNPLYIWGALGDRLANRLNVPILFLGAAQPATSSEQWRQSAEGTGQYAGTLLPYRRLGVSLLHYASRTGLRAVLWHQGEGDTGKDAQRYFDNIRTIINKSRQQTNYGALTWVVARASYVQGRTDGAIINAQNRLSSEIPNVFAGPNTDQLTGPDNRPDDVHFNGSGLSRLTDLWDQSLNGDFFGRSSPYSLTGDRPAITTGYVLPASINAGQTVYLPYVRNGPFTADNQFNAELLRPDGSVAGIVGSGTGNPLSITLPGNVSPGGYRVRVVSTHPTLTGTPSEGFQVGTGTLTPTAPPAPPIQTPVNGGTPDASIRLLGYKFDAIAHSFHLLVNATGPVDVRLERLDGSFGETNWGPVSANTEFSGFNNDRYYSPITPGIGGVEPGRYRLSARRRGDGSSGQWTEVTLLNGKFTVYTAGDNVQPTPTPQPNPTSPTQPAQPPTTGATTDASIRKIAYAYDAANQGFQLLADATGPIEMRLERLDGPFGETSWWTPIASNAVSGYNYLRAYGPGVLIADGRRVAGVEPGRYRLSVRKLGDTGNGTTVDVTLQSGLHNAYTVGDSTQPNPVPNPPAPPPSQPPADAFIRRIGYQYDAANQGFQLLTDATGAIEMRLERLDGPFGETSWWTPIASNAVSGYNYLRAYGPGVLIADGRRVAGVEPGRYRLSVRKLGDTGNGTTVEVTLTNGLYTVYNPNTRSAAADAGAEPDETTWRAWPNPFVSEVTIRLPAGVPMNRIRVLLLGVNGRGHEIEREDLRVDNNLLRVRLASAPEASYLLQILDDNRPLRTLKLVKQL